MSRDSLRGSNHHHNDDRGSSHLGLLVDREHGRVPVLRHLALDLAGGSLRGERAGVSGWQPRRERCVRGIWGGAGSAAARALMGMPVQCHPKGNSACLPRRRWYATANSAWLERGGAVRPGARLDQHDNRLLRSTGGALDPHLGQAERVAEVEKAVHVRVREVGEVLLAFACKERVVLARIACVSRTLRPCSGSPSLCADSMPDLRAGGGSILLEDFVSRPFLLSLLLDGAQEVAPLRVLAAGLRIRQIVSISREWWAWDVPTPEESERQAAISKAHLLGGRHGWRREGEDRLACSGSWSAALPVQKQLQQQRCPPRAR